jgi:hypothetical protein
MSSRLRVDVSLSTKEMVQGELYWVTSTVTNISDEPIALAKMDYNSFITYELQFLGKGGAAATDELKTIDDMSIVTISQAIYKSWRSGGYPYEKFPDEVVEVGPGESISVTEDLSEFTIEPLIAGHYAAFAHYRYEDFDESSDAEELDIIALRAGHFSQVFCPMEGVASSVYDHKSDEGNSVLFHSRAQNEVPFTSVARRRYEFGSPVSDFSIACHTAEEGEGQWFGWIADGAIGAARAWNHIIPVEAQLASLEQPTAKLIQPGFQRSDQSGVFLTFADDNGSLSVQLARFSEGGVALSASIIVGDTYAEHVEAHYVPHPEGDRIDLVWAEPRGKGHAVYSRALKLDGKFADGAAQLLYECDAPVLCCEVECFSFGDMASVHLLVAPEDPEGELTYLQVSMDPAEMMLHAFPVPPPDMQILSWAIAPTEAGELGVLASTSDAIFYADAKDEPAWSTVIEDLPSPPAFLELNLATDETAWASWGDGELGIRYLKVGAKAVEQTPPVDTSDDGVDTEDLA